MPDDPRQSLGKLGEDIACAELARRGYAILARRSPLSRKAVDHEGHEGPEERSRADRRVLRALRGSSLWRDTCFAVRACPMTPVNPSENWVKTSPARSWPVAGTQSSRGALHCHERQLTTKGTKVPKNDQGQTVVCFVPFVVQVFGVTRALPGAHAR